MNENQICNECGRELNPDEGRLFDGQHLCDECYRARTVCCDHCGERIWREDCESDGNTVICNRCWSDHYTTCDDCGAFIPNDEAYWDGDGDDRYCRECYYKRRRVAKEYEEVPIMCGTIMKIAPNGKIETETFNYNTYVGKSWWEYGGYGFRGQCAMGTAKSARDAYVEELKIYAYYVGIEPSLVDELIQEGFSFDEIEEMIYAGYSG